MQGPYTINEPSATKREFLFFLVDATDLATPETGEGGGQPQIRKPGEITWTNTEETLIHVGNGHYVVVLSGTELNTFGIFSIRYKTGNTVEFQDIGYVQSSGEVSLDSVNQLIRQILTRVKYLEFIAKQRERDVDQQDELTVL
jgi:hypothetical protein